MSKKLMTVCATFVVFGVYTHGALAGKTNPKAFVRMTYYGESFKECKAKLISDIDGAFYRVESVADMAAKKVEAPMVEHVENVEESEPDVIGKIESAKTIGEVLSIIA